MFKNHSTVKSNAVKMRRAYFKIYARINECRKNDLKYIIYEQNSNRKHYHVGNLESQLIDQAKKMLEEVGPDKLSIRAIAEQLAESATAVYHHFANKDELNVSHLAAEAFNQLGKSIDSMSDQC